MVWAILRQEDIRKKKAAEAEEEVLSEKEPEEVKSQEVLPKQPVKLKKVGGDKPCPCGSGKKYKRCCKN